MIGFYEVLALPPSPLRSGIQICVEKYEKTSGFTSENALSDATLEQNILFGQKISRRGPKSSPAGPHPPRKLLSRTAFHEEKKSDLHHSAAKPKFRRRLSEKVRVLQTKSLPDFTTPQRNARLEPFFDQKKDSAAEWRSRYAF